MAVEIPRIKRFDPLDPQSVGRVEVSAPNIAEASSAAIQGTQSGIGKALDATADYHKRVRKAEITSWDVTSTDLNNKYESWYKSEINVIAQKDGDTSKDYLDLDLKAEEKKKELFTGFENMTPEFQTMLDQKVESTHGKLRGLREIQQATQRFKFEENVSKNRIKLSQDSFLNYGMYLDVKKPDTFVELDKHRMDIEQTHKARGERHGTLTYNEDGSVNPLGGEVGVLIRKDMGDAVIPLVKSLNAAGKVAEGKELINKYGDYLNAADKAKLLSDSDEANVRNLAINALVGITSDKMKKNPKDPNSRNVNVGDINDLEGISEPVRFKMKELNEINQRQAKMESERKAEKIMNDLIPKLLANQAGPTAFVNKADALQSDLVKKALDSGVLNPTQINHILSHVEAPLKSKPGALDALNQGIANNDLYKKTATQKAEIYAGLDEDGRKIFNATVSEQLADSKKKAPGEALSATTGSEIAATIVKSLTEKMKKPVKGETVFKVNKKGKFVDGYDEAMLSTYTEFIKQDIMNLGKKPSFAEQQEIINHRFSQMVEQRKKDTSGLWNSLFKSDREDFAEPIYEPVPGIKKQAPSFSNVPSTLKVESPSTPAPKAATVSKSGNVGLPPVTDRAAWNNLYKQAKGSRPSTSAQLKAFQEEMNKKAGK